LPGCAVAQISDFNFQTAEKTTVRDLAAHAPELCKNVALEKTEGAGNAGRPMRPQPRV
jgi:hypothetical protein